MDTQIAAQFKRFQIIQEVLNTEYLYVEDLKILVKHFLTPVRERQLLPSPEIPQIFLNVELILAFHADLLAKLMKRLGVEKIAPARSSGRSTGDLVLESSSKGRSISYHVGDIFKEMSRNFVVYKHYCSNYKKSMDAIQRAKKISSFADFLQAQSKLPEVRNLSLRDYMIKPIQRICKYPLLFRNLLENTPTDHRDYKLQVECLETLEKMVTYINISRKEAENIHTMMMIETSMTNCKVRLAEAGRHFKLDGQLAQLVQSGARVAVRQCYLFSDIFLVAKSKKASFLGSKNFLQFVCAIPLATATLKSVEDQKEKGRLNGFQIEGFEEGRKDEARVRKTFVFFARNAAEKELWMGKIKKAIDKRAIERALKRKAHQDKEKEKQELREVVRLKRKVEKQQKMIENLKSFVESEFEEKRSMLGEIEKLKATDVEKECEIRRLQEEIAALRTACEEQKATAASPASSPGTSEVPPSSPVRASKPTTSETDTHDKRGSMAFFKAMSQGVDKLLETEKAKVEAERKEKEEQRNQKERERDEREREFIESRTRAIRADSILVEDEWIQTRSKVLSLEDMLESDEDEDESYEKSDNRDKQSNQEKSERQRDTDEEEEDEPDEEDEIKKFYESGATAANGNSGENKATPTSAGAGSGQDEQAEEVNLFEFIAKQADTLGEGTKGKKKVSRSKKNRFATPSKMWPFKKPPTSPSASQSSLPTVTPTSSGSPSPSPSPLPAPTPTPAAEPGNLSTASPQLPSTSRNSSSSGVPTRFPPPVPSRTPSMQLLASPVSSAEAESPAPTTAPPSSSGSSEQSTASSEDDESDGEDFLEDDELGDRLKAMRDSKTELATRRTRASIMLYFGNK